MVTRKEGSEVQVPDVSVQVRSRLSIRLCSSKGIDGERWHGVSDGRL